MLESRMIVLLIAALVIMLIIAALSFSWSLYRILKLIPEEKHTFKIGTVWLFIIPVVGLFAQWYILPFGIPKTLNNAFPTNEAMHAEARKLYQFGLIQVILLSLSFFIPYSHILELILVSLIAAVYWMLYWKKLINIKKHFLLQAFNHLK